MPLKPQVVLLAVIVLFIQGCIIKVLPESTSFDFAEKPAVVRLGEVTESVTGTWEIYPEAGFKNRLLKALRKKEVASYFSHDMSALVLDIHLTTDHADDGPRLANLGALSIATLGVIPLNFSSEWATSCDVSISKPDGTPIADYVFHEAGTYDIWAFPWTPLTLLGAGIRGNHDGGRVAKRVTENLIQKILDTIDQNYAAFSAKTAPASSETKPGAKNYQVPSPTLIT